jgi:hypothetical protein
MKMEAAVCYKTLITTEINTTPHFVNTRGIECEILFKEQFFFTDSHVLQRLTVYVVSQNKILCD